MKRKVLIIFLSFVGVFMTAEPVSGSIEPNQYKEKEVKIKTGVFNDGNITETKKELPELQKNLTFSGTYKKRHKELEEELFLKEMNENNSIISKTSQLGMFSDGEKSFRKQSPGTFHGNSSDIWNFQLVLVILITITLLSMFLLLIPRIARMQEERK